MKESSIQSVFLVRSAHLNHQGHLFGGHLMAEIDTVSFCLLRRDYPRLRLVTRAAEISFDRPVALGDTVIFEARLLAEGQTSIKVSVSGTVKEERICHATMTFVNIDERGQKALLPPPPRG